MSNEERKRAAWEKHRTKGIIRYVLKMGLLYFGLSYFLIWVFLVPLIDNSFSFSFIYRETFTTRAITYGIVSIFWGLLMGLVLWKGNEKRYAS